MGLSGKRFASLSGYACNGMDWNFCRGLHIEFSPSAIDQNHQRKESRRNIEVDAFRIDDRRGCVDCLRRFEKGFADHFNKRILAVFKPCLNSVAVQIQPQRKVMHPRRRMSELEH